MKILEDFIKILHILIILFIIGAPFSNDPRILIVHVSSCISLIVHWYFNNDTCCLTLMESYLSGKKKKETFMGRLISPVYTLDESTTSKVTYYSTIVLMLISVAKLSRMDKNANLSALLLPYQRKNSSELISRGSFL